jgi:hypothetical protein
LSRVGKRITYGNRNAPLIVASVQNRPEDSMGKRVRPKLEEFEISENEVVHKPTKATWTAYAGRPEPHLYRQSMLGSVLPNGDDYREDEVTAMALKLLAER